MRIILSGGGTMGHVSPALAIADAIKKECKSSDILFIGRESGDENNKVINSGYELKTVRISGLSRSISIENIKNLFIAFSAVKEAKKIIKDFSPDLVLGTGGYVSFPALFAAQRLSVPTLIHESNASFGLVTRMLGKECTRLLLNYPGSENNIKNKKNISVVGNPVNEAFYTADRAYSRKILGVRPDEIFILSIGGSGGSAKLNEVILKTMKNHSDKTKKLRHIHSCGKKYYEDIKSEYPEFTKNISKCKIVPYIDNMPTVMKAADIVISRCGAVTLSEISAVGVASILIPSPNVSDNHQYKNAKFISDRNGAILIEESELSERSMLDALKLLETDKSKRNAYANSIHGFHKSDSAKCILDEIKKILSTN